MMASGRGWLRLSRVGGLLLGLAIVLAVAPAAAAAPGRGTGPRPDVYTLPGDDVFPEGIAYHDATGRFFVSATADGTIFRGHVQHRAAEVFMAGGGELRPTAVGLEVDRYGRLFIAGGATGRMFAHDASSGELLAAFDNGQAATFVNDVAATRSGEAFFTDSFHPAIYRLSGAPGEPIVAEVWLSLAGTPIAYEDGFNLNGIVVTDNDRYLIVVQSNVGKLFRIDLQTKEVVEVAVEGGSLTAGDGLVLRGHTLYVVRNQFGRIAEVRLSGDYTRGTVVGEVGDPTFAFPTTAAQARGRLLVVNSQFDAMGDSPDLPFTVSSVGLP